MTARIGILGGTFDPIHYGHLAIAEEARSSLGLDTVLFVPAGQQPFKRGRNVAPAAHRLAMVELACADNPAFAVSALEIERAGVSYTITTLETLAEQQLGELFFILGADALADLPKWRRAHDLPKLAQIAAIQRPGTTLDATALQAALPGLEQRLHLLQGPALAISSTELRQRVATGRSIRYLTPESVRAYIMRAGLYHVEQSAVAEP